MTEIQEETTEIQKEIRERLESLELRYHMKILYAGETGSRLWGYAHSKSDWDIKFFFIRPISYYLSLHKLPNDTYIEEKGIGGNQDYTGWCLTKTLKLIFNNNIQPYEWANAPGVHKTIIGAKYHFEDEVRSLYKKWYCRNTFFHQYLNLTTKDFDQHIKYPLTNNTLINHRKLLITLRECLSTLWVNKFNNAPPLCIPTLMMNLEEMVEDFWSYYSFKKETLPDLQDLIQEGRENHQRKSNDDYNRITHFIKSCLEYFPYRYDHIALNARKNDNNTIRMIKEEHNKIFLDILYEQAGMIP